MAISWLWAGQFLVMATLHDVLLLGISAGIGSVVGPIFNVAFGAEVYRVTPDRLIGRVRSVAKTVAWGTIPLGALSAGFLANGIGAQASIAVLGVLLIAPAVATLFGRGSGAEVDR